MTNPAQAEIILHDYWRSSSAYRVRIALSLLGLDYKRKIVDLLKEEQKGADYLRRNGQGLVPSLEIDGLMLTQSLAIIEYLNDVHSAGFLPDEPSGRAKVRALAYAIAMDIQPICNLRVAKYAVKQANGAITMEGWMQHFIRQGLEGVEEMLVRLKAKNFCYGTSVSLADICLIPQLYNARRWGVELNNFPNILKVADTLEKIPGFMTAHPDKAQAGP